MINNSKTSKNINNELFIKDCISSIDVIEKDQIEPIFYIVKIYEEYVEKLADQFAIIAKTKNKIISKEVLKRIIINCIIKSCFHTNPNKNLDQCICEQVTSLEHKLNSDSDIITILTESKSIYDESEEISYQEPKSKYKKNPFF